MKEIIFAYLSRNGSITTLEAMRDLGCLDLQSCIRDLRKEYNITDEWVHTTNRYGIKIKYKRYYLKEN